MVRPVLQALRGQWVLLVLRAPPVLKALLALMGLTALLALPDRRGQWV